MLRWLFKRRKKKAVEPYVCKCVYPVGTINLCKKWGCPDDPNWKGDGCRP